MRNRGCATNFTADQLSIVWKDWGIIPISGKRKADLDLHFEQFSMVLNSADVKQLMDSPKQTIKVGENRRVVERNSFFSFSSPF